MNVALFTITASKNQDKKSYLEKNIFTGRVNDKMSRKSTFTGRSNDKMIRFRSEEFPTTLRSNKPLKHRCSMQTIACCWKICPNLHTIK